MTEGRGRLPWVALSLLAAGCATSPAPAGPELLDIQGAVQRPMDASGATANVLIFTTVDCPIANGYAPEITDIAERYGPAGFRFFMVHVDPDVDPERARAHAREYGLGLPILLDPEHTLVAATGATVTPEVAVVGPRGALLYRGRIDNLYADLGTKRRAATRHDLRDALEALAARESVSQARTEAIGCFIPDRP